MIKDIKELLGTEKLLLGTERTMKALRNGTLQKIFLTSNVDADVKEDIEYYKSVSGVEVEELKETNEELGTICRKSFSISVIGILK